VGPRKTGRLAVARPLANTKYQTRPALVYTINVTVRNISEAKAELSALIEAVQNGGEVIIAKAGKPVARLVAFRGPAGPRTPGSMAGEIWISPDFDSLPDDMADAFGMKEPRS
jgi:prevent-host-death family protein